MPREVVNPVISDFIWPTLDGDPVKIDCEERKKLKTETDLIAKAASNLGSDEEKLKWHLGKCEKLLEAEGSRKASIDARLLSTAGLVSIAATVVLGNLFTLSSEKLTLNSANARVALMAGCLYLSLQLVAALQASVRGLRATRYDVDELHKLLPSQGIKHSFHLRHRIEQVLVRVAEHRQTNNGKLDQLNIAHTALRNFLWGLLVVALIAFVVPLAWPISCSPMLSELPWPDQVNHAKCHVISLFKQSLFSVSIGIFFLTLGGVLLGLSNSTSRRVVAVAITIIGLGFTILGMDKLDTTLFRIDRMINELRLEVPMVTKSLPHHAFVRRIATVGPFPDGELLLSIDEVAKCLTFALAQYEGRSIGGWEVVGRVDKRQFVNTR